MVREWRPEDTPGVIETIRAVFDEYGFTWDEAEYHADLYDIRGHYFDKGHTFWVAEAHGRVVGTVALERFPRLPGTLGDTVEVGGRTRIAGADCSLERLYVHPSARKKGLGSLLVQRVLGQARSEGRTALEMWSDKRFGDAHRLYGRFGAEIVGDRICHDPDQSPEWGLLIRLDPQRAAPDATLP